MEEKPSDAPNMQQKERSYLWVLSSSLSWIGCYVAWVLPCNRTEGRMLAEVTDCGITWLAPIHQAYKRTQLTESSPSMEAWSISQSGNRQELKEATATRSLGRSNL